MTAVDYSWEKYDLGTAEHERIERIRKALDKAIKNGGKEMNKEEILKKMDIYAKIKAEEYMYNIVNTDLICPNCGEGHIIREEPKVINPNTERYTYLCTDCGFEHTAKSDEDMMKWIKNLDKPIEEEILKKQVQDFIGMVKETDYHAKQDYGKAKLSLVPRQIIWDIAAIREYGNNKYPDGGPDNWKSVEPERYRDAAYRHFLRYLDNPKAVDDESGLPHLWHLACNIAFLCELEAEAKESITLYKNDKPYLVINPDNGSGITIDDRVSITMPKTERIDESPKRDCSNCKYVLSDASFETCRTCEDGFTNWEPKTERGESE